MKIRPGMQGPLIAACLLAALIGSAQPGGQFRYPVSVAVGPNGNISISENARNRISVFDSNGGFISRFGALGSANGQLNSPAGIASDSAGAVYVADLKNSRVQ